MDQFLDVYSLPIFNSFPTDLQVKMTVQGEAIAGTILQQTFIVEYVVNHQMCDECRRVEAKDLWSAMVMNFIPFFVDHVYVIIVFHTGPSEAKDRPEKDSILS